MDKRTRHDLIDVLARVLHYQDKSDEPPPDSDYATLAKEMEALPPRIIERYQNDARFHAQVNRAFAMVVEVIEKRS